MNEHGFLIVFAQIPRLFLKSVWESHPSNRIA